MTNALAKLDKATQMLAEAKTLDEVKNILDIAEAARVYARAAKLGLDAYNHAAEVKVRAERKAGELLLKLEKNNKGGDRKSRSHHVTVISEFAETLEENGITKQVANRWQTLAAMPEKKFEKHIAETRGERPITTSAIIQEVKKEKVKEKLEDTAAQAVKAASGLYDVIVIDPPWQMEKIEREVAPNQVSFDYPTMALDEIQRLNIPCADDCHVFMWTTHKYLPDSFDILKAWGVKYVCTFVWHKAGGFQPFGLPQYNCEFALYARMGTPQFIDLKDFKVCFDGIRGKHSEKPEEFYNLLRRVTGGRRLDMFNRRTIEGFDGWGNEAK